ncbi:hypothetical protein [Rhizobium tumorigenes]|uniref:hypothetical protein n=1 Tax=Rhizobium tumorigenes TaxID=2041385 RepID=UPI00241DE3F7|nr:hypothetical protein [Rhizobium tumorigenes]WFS00066.1 hypothetical protein PR016_13015 [Rhizobium tumorigenes]
MTSLPKDIDDALARYMADHGLGRDASVSKILAEWLGAHDYLGGDGTVKPDDMQQTVQYPEFIDDASGGAGG